MSKSKTKTPRRTADPVLDYAHNVLSGAVIAGRWVKLAAERHRADGKRRDLVWVLDVCAACRPEKKYSQKNPCPHSALYAIGFFRDVLRLNGGQFEGKPFILEPFEIFIVGSLFGWHLRDGRRRFNTAYVEICKGNGKSPLAAGIGHYGFIADQEPRAEIYAAATKKDQAMILFRDAAAMRDQSPHLAARLQKSGVGEKCWNLADHKTGSWFRPISSDEDSQSGPRPHFALVDEVHEHKSSVVIDMLSAGFKWRRNPLMFMITNSGFDRTTVCWRYHEYVTRILKRTAANDALFGFICALDPCEKHWFEGNEQPVDNCKACDDWATEGPHWQKANPNLGVSIDLKYLRAQVQKGIDMPAEQNTVRRLNFGYWTNQATRWLSMQAWDSCGAPIDFERLRGRSCILGIDLANTIDIAAMVALFPPQNIPMREVKFKNDAGQEETRLEIDEASVQDEFIVVPYFWIPKDNLQEAIRRDNVPYDAWARDGLIYPTEGNVIDYSAIKQKIVALKDIYPIRTQQVDNQTVHMIGFDPWNGTEFANDLADKFSLNMIQVRQGYQTMSEPTKAMARLLKAGKVRHGGNPVLRWMADNVVVRTDPAGNLKPDKEKSKQKIDGIVALIIALSLAIRLPAARKSVYEERGVLRV